jgi:hypothetical protein
VTRRRASYKRTEPGSPANRLKPIEQFKPLDPDKPLAPYRVPPLKAFDRQMPGQGVLDFTQDGPVITWPEDETG